MIQALASIGLLMSPVGPMSSSLGVTIEELALEVVLDSLLHMQRTIPVWKKIPLLPLPETPQEEVIPLAPATREMAVEVIRLRKRNCKYLKRHI